MDEALGCVATFVVVALSVYGLLLGLKWLLVNGWPYLLGLGLLVLVGLVIWAARRRYLASEAYQVAQIDQTVEQAEQELEDAYRQAKAQMDQASREWNQLQ